MAHLALGVVTAGLAGTVLLSGCVRRAGPAPGTVNDPSVAASADAIRYRTLTWADFRGREPPVSAGPHRALGASSCVRLVPQMPQRIVTRPAAAGGYHVTAPRAAFHAEMDRACSWWNRRTPRDRAAYLLQHEQVHFALVELYARRLTAAVRGAHVVVPSRDSAAAVLRRHIGVLVDSTVLDLVRENAAFDRETADRYAPAAQQAWLDRVERALAEVVGPVTGSGIVPES